jgi:type IV fimbrial biogenesis protein FimT
MQMRAASGMSLIELLIGFLVVGVLLALGIPSFGTWLQNIQVRGAADAIQGGLQLARATAVQRNKFVRFNMPGPDSSWTVTIVDPALALGETAMVQSRSGAEGTINAVTATANPTITFDGLGRAMLPAATVIQVTNPTGGTCFTDIRCLNVTVSVGGQIKMCDPHPDIAPGDSRAC